MQWEGQGPPPIIVAVPENTDLPSELAHKQPPTHVLAISSHQTCSGWQLQLPGLYLPCLLPPFQTLHAFQVLPQSWQRR